MFEIIISILPFIIPTSIIGDNLSYLISSLLGISFILINIRKMKLDKYFYLCFLSFIAIFITQVFISPYIESIAGSFLYFNIPIYYLIYKYIFNKRNKNTILKNIVIAISIVGIISLIYQGLYLNLRVYGNLGYANSYALLLLVGLYLNKIREEDNLSNLIDRILLLLILFTGSRTTLLLLLIYVGYDIYNNIKIGKRGKINTLIKSLIISFVLYILLEKLRLIGVFVLPVLYILYKSIKDIKISNKIYCFIGLIVLIITMLSNTNTINRIKNISLETGTFQERLVYYEDAIKTIMARPFGNGINMFQYKLYQDASAFYDVKYIHNSFLQVIYDNGIINFVIFMTIIVIGLISVIKSKANYKNYLILAYISIMIHSLLDFDLSFAIFLILIAILIILGDRDYKDELKDKKEDKHNEKIIQSVTRKEEIKTIIRIRRILYSIILIVVLYLGVFEGGILLGRELLSGNNKVAANVLKNINKLSLNKDYRGYFYRADALRNIYNENKDENRKSLEEAINSLEISKEINIYDPRVTWNLSYLYEEMGDREKALKYGEQVVKSERFYPGVYIKQYDYLMSLYEETEDIEYLKSIEELEGFYYKNYKELNKRAKYMNEQLQENYDNIRSNKGWKI